MPRIARNPASLRTSLRPSCLAIAMALGTLSLDASIASSAPPTTAEATFAAAMARHPGGPALSAEQQLAIIERAQARQSSLPAVPAAAIPVTNCNDAGPGSYRQAMLNAISGDTIDMTAIGCSSITLTTGNVTATADNLILQGPGQLSLVIDGDDAFSQVRHSGSGVLTVRDLTLINGNKYSVATSGLNAAGGCASSQGTMVLINAGAKYCEVQSNLDGIGVKGGGLYSKFGTELLRSVIAGNRAVLNGSNGKVAGGGVFSGQRINMTDSTVTGNQAEATGGNSPAVAGGVSVGGTGLVAGLGGNSLIGRSIISENSAIGAGSQVDAGGLWVKGSVQIIDSTISGNMARRDAGVFVTGDSSVDSVVMNSTISGNRSTDSGGSGLVFNNDRVEIRNSTVAFNQSGNGFSASQPGAGLRLQSGSTALLVSSIISDNQTFTTFGLFSNDLNGDATASVTGNRNLIPASGIAVPADTRTGSAALQILGNNGGPTQTHRLGASSEAIDNGSNPYTLPNDQRGTGFPRVSGPRADIGAFELPADMIFTNGFDAL